MLGLGVGVGVGVGVCVGVGVGQDGTANTPIEVVKLATVDKVITLLLSKNCSPLEPLIALFF